MVQSLLNPSINYPESKQLEKNDTENESYPRQSPRVIDQRSPEPSQNAAVTVSI